MKSSRFAFLSDIRPKYVSGKICANANDATIIPISKTDFATKLEENVVHGSDSPESADRELSLFFKK